MKRLAGLLAVLWAAGCGGDEFGQARAEASGGAQAGAAAASVGQVGGEATVSAAGSGGTVRPYGGQAGSVETGGAPGTGAGGRPGGSGGAPGPGGTLSSGGEGGGLEGGAPGVGGTGAGATGGIHAGGLPGVGGETVGGAPALGGLVEPPSGGSSPGGAGVGGELVVPGLGGLSGSTVAVYCESDGDCAELCEPADYEGNCSLGETRVCQCRNGPTCDPYSLERGPCPEQTQCAGTVDGYGACLAGGDAGPGESCTGDGWLCGPGTTCWHGYPDGTGWCHRRCSPQEYVPDGCDCQAGVCCLERDYAEGYCES
jgi:hypothetical protein